MNGNLTPKLAAMVREKVESGLYNNASEVVRGALRQRAIEAVTRAEGAHVSNSVQPADSSLSVGTK